ncbi:leucine--tRNA ligase, partial [Candidatus Bathyarchaeota archaeon]|nr:leucine--tRNA ligase [Candidatus Bathyarchaeota archaeon]
GAAERLRKGDLAIVREFKEIDGVPDEALKTFYDPANIAMYYTAQNRETVKRIGFSIDWRREFHTTSLEPNFSRFVEWQYRRLRDGGYVSMGTHPVVWCPQCESPTGDHDRLEGEGVSPEEYTLVKFRLGDAFLVAATFRPETIFGVTNLWLNPEGDYVEAQVDEERWVISAEAAEKLKEQLRSVSVVKRVRGSELVGSVCIDPVAGRPLLILPGWFVDPGSASGLVYSVPAHAPFDWVALRDLRAKPELAERYGISRKQLEAITPIGIISVEGYGEYPAIEIVDELGVKDQEDPKCEEATKTIYRKEFHTGILKPNCGRYAGARVRDVKDEVVKDLRQAGVADSMLDLPGRVVCRCTSLCRVKTVQGQWFLRYSDPEWKQKTKTLLSKAKVYPESARRWFIDVIDWYRDWPCARKTGLGTPLPWSPDWIIETLSDSTVYMAFYTISKEVRRLNLTPDQLTDEFFDYTFLGRGRLEEVAEKTGIESAALKSMREEFLYWYPVDLRVSAKELLPNHLTFFLFQHAALFSQEHWPRGVGVNGMLMIEGEKMSKSKGNIVTLRRAVEEYGADVTRCTLLLGADGMDDPDWRSESLRDVGLKLESFIDLARQMIESEDTGETDHLDDWLISRMHDRIVKVTESIENLRMRAAAENVVYGIPSDVRWYLRRRQGLNRRSALPVLEAWVRLMTPLSPHISEEVWEQLGRRGFVSSADWPSPDEFRKNIKAELIEEMIQRTIEDVNNIVRATQISPGHIILYTAADWKWRSWLMLLEGLQSGSSDVKTMLERLESIPALRERMREVSAYIQAVSKEAVQTAPDARERLLAAGVIDELEALRGATQFLSRELKAEVAVYMEDDDSRYDPKGRARLAKPHRPAIYVE